MTLHSILRTEGAIRAFHSRFIICQEHHRFSGHSLLHATFSCCLCCFFLVLATTPREHTGRKRKRSKLDHGSEKDDSNLDELDTVFHDGKVEPAKKAFGKAQSYLIRANTVSQRRTAIAAGLRQRKADLKLQNQKLRDKISDLQKTQTSHLVQTPPISQVSQTLQSRARNLEANLGNIPPASGGSLDHTIARPGW